MGKRKIEELKESLDQFTDSCKNCIHSVKLRIVVLSAKASRSAYEQISHKILSNTSQSSSKRSSYTNEPFSLSM